MIEKEKNKSLPAGRQGFTLIEILIVSGALILLMLLSVVSLNLFTKKSELDAYFENTISALNMARNRALASEGAGQFGIYLDISSIPNRYILFQGSNYISRDVSFDLIFKLPSSIEFSNISFNGGGSEVVFNKLEGDTNNYGSFIIKSLSTSEFKNIYIYFSGKISGLPEPVSGPGRLTDSRHVHFDLGWDMTGASDLKFNFINAGQIEQVPIIDYFTPTSFEWEGNFIINSVIQEFKIHTHQLGSTTVLCIHRNLDEGKNNEEVYIYIIQGGIDKEIAHYDDDQYSTVNKGIYVWNTMQKQ